MQRMRLLCGFLTPPFGVDRPSVDNIALLSVRVFSTGDDGVSFLLAQHYEVKGGG